MYMYCIIYIFFVSQKYCKYAYKREEEILRRKEATNNQIKRKPNKNKQTTTTIKLVSFFIYFFLLNILYLVYIRVMHPDNCHLLFKKILTYRSGFYWLLFRKIVKTIPYWENELIIIKIDNKCYCFNFHKFILIAASHYVLIKLSSHLVILF